MILKANILLKCGTDNLRLSKLREKQMLHVLYQGRNLELPMGEHKNEMRGVGHEGRNRRARGITPPPPLPESQRF